jgi:aminoglycoside phosphotransferase (APT) family kinase protein
MGVALERAGRLPSAHMHGDFQRRNVLLAGPRVSVVDWEGAWLHGLPGLDLVFLALLARGDVPDADVISAVLAGADPPFGPLSRYLSLVGVSGATLRPALFAMLGSWMLGEERRLRRSLATPSSTRLYQQLVLSFASRLSQ